MLLSVIGLGLSIKISVNYSIIFVIMSSKLIFQWYIITVIKHYVKTTHRTRKSNIYFANSIGMWW